MSKCEKDKDFAEEAETYCLSSDNEEWECKGEALWINRYG